jgi:O-antigen/teichoic acid export membrane protein
MDALIPKNNPEPVRLGSVLLSLSGDSLVYFFGAALMGMGSFILVPLYARHLTPSQFGTYALVDVTLLILVTVSQAKLDVSYLRWFAELEESRRPALQGTILGAGLVLGTATGFVLSAVASVPVGRGWLQMTGRSFAWWLMPIVVLECLQSLLLSDLRARRRSAVYSLASLVRLATFVGASWWFLTKDNAGLYGIFAGRLVGDLAGVTFMVLFAVRVSRLRVDLSLLRPMLRFGAPMIWSGFMMLLLDATGRYFISRYATLDQVGYYGAAIKLAAVFQMFVSQPFSIAWGGVMFQIVKLANARLIYSKILTYIFVLSLAAGLCLAVLSPTLFSLFLTRAYAPAMLVFPWILLVRCVSMLEFPCGIGIFLRGRTHWFAFIYTAGLLANLAGNAVLTRFWGMFGAVFAWLAAWAVIVVLLLVVGQRLYSLMIEWRLMAAPCCAWLLYFGWRSLGRPQPGLFWQFVMVLAILSATGMFLMRDLRSTQERAHAGSAWALEPSASD